MSEFREGQIRKEVSQGIVDGVLKLIGMLMLLWIGTIVLFVLFVDDRVPVRGEKSPAGLLPVIHFFEILFFWKAYAPIQIVIINHVVPSLCKSLQAKRPPVLARCNVDCEVWFCAPVLTRSPVRVGSARAT